MGLQVVVGAVTARGTSKDFGDAVALYRDRIAGYAAIELPLWDSEARCFDWVVKQRTRTAPLLVLLDSRGKSYSSEGFARWLGQERDGGRQSVILAIGPAGGWSDGARERANMLLSLGAMTLPHELARVVLLEQVYRAFTILAGHPYHCGH